VSGPSGTLIEKNSSSSSDHQEFAGAEPEGLRARYSKAEQAVRVVLHLRHLFGEHAGGDDVVVNGFSHINTVRYNERHIGGNGKLRKCKIPCATPYSPYVQSI
jgi:hypothetical protein